MRSDRQFQRLQMQVVQVGYQVQRVFQMPFFLFMKFDFGGFRFADLEQNCTFVRMRISVRYPLMNMNRQVSIGILIVGLSLLAGCSGRQKQAKPLPTVQTGVVEPYGESQKLEFPGRVKAAQEVNLAFKLAGTLQRFLVPEGTHVRQGDVLVQLDPRDYRLQLDAVEAEYRRIKAQAERVMALYADSAATADDYDKARYGLRQIEAKYRNCKNQLADTELRAPFDGFVQRHLLDRGTVVGAGMPVVSVISGEAPEVEINIPGAEYVRRNEFAGFEGSFDFWPGRRIALTLLSISPKANANQLYTVRLGIAPGTDPMPSPGMNTMVEVAFRSSDETRSSIPATALFAERQESFVWVIGEDSVVVRRPVRVLSLHSDGSAVVGSELEAGERIVTAGVHSLHEGEKVAPMAEPSETNVGGLL